jgi:hypothetical protein
MGAAKLAAPTYTIIADEPVSVFMPPLNGTHKLLSKLPVELVAGYGKLTANARLRFPHPG